MNKVLRLRAITIAISLLSLIASKIDQFKKQLVQLPALAPGSFSLTSTTLAAGNHRMDEYDLSVPKDEVEILVSRGDLEARVLVTTFCDRGNRKIEIKEGYAIPELPYEVVVVSYIGIPIETCYAKPAILVLRATDR